MSRDTKYWEEQSLKLCKRPLNEMKELMNQVCKDWSKNCKKGEKLTKQRAFRKCLVDLKYPLMGSSQTPMRGLLGELTKELTCFVKSDASPIPTLTIRPPIRPHKTKDAAQQVEVNITDFDFTTTLETNGI